MNSPNFLYFIWFLVLCLLGSCNKDKDRINVNSILIIGDKTKVIITRCDSIINGSYPHPMALDLDLDKDGTMDIRLYSEEWGDTSILNQHPRSSIICLREDVQLFSLSTLDTTYYKKTFSCRPGFNNEVNCYDAYISSCYGNPAVDSISSINPVYKILPLYTNDIIRSEGTFHSDTFVLSEPEIYHPQIPTGSSGDTLFFTYMLTINTCNNFPNGEIKYVGYKLTDRSKLGWIKLSIYNNTIVFVLETAIQRVICFNY